MSAYEVMGITTALRFTSRASVKIRDNFYTVEACEERAIPDVEGIDVDEERKALWETVNKECDDQIQEILRCFQK